MRRHNSKECNDFGEAELRRWWRDPDVLPACEEWAVGAEHDPDAVVDLITAAVNW